MENNNSSKRPAIFAGGPFLRYKMDPIDHPVYGQATWTGDLPLLLPFRGHTLEQIVPELPVCRRIAEELIDLGRSVWADDDDERILEKLFEYTYGCSIMGGMLPSDPRLPLFVSAMVIFIQVDDQLDSLDSLEGMTGSLKQIRDTYHEADPIMDRPIPAATVDMARMLTCWDDLKAKLLEIPDYRAKYDVALRQEIYLFIASHVAQSELKKAGLAFSETTSRDLLRNIASPAIVTEYVAILRDAILPAYVRSDVLFSVARNKVSDVELAANAILGLHRDIKLGQTDSSIMYDVTSGRLPLQAAIEKTYQDLLDAMQDLKLATDKLLEVYEGDENVVKYVHIMVGGMDGMLYCYKFWQRYGLADKLTLFEK